MLYQSDEVLYKLTKKLNCLAIQQVFNFFQVSQFTAPNPEKNEKLKRFLQGLFEESHFKELSDLILKINQHDEQTALVYLTFRQVIEAVKTLDLYKVPDLLRGLDTDKAVGQVKEINFMNYLSDLRQVDELFFDDAGSGSQREELQILQQEWINMAFSFLKGNRMADSIRIAQEMAYLVIQTPAHLKQIWAYIESTHDLLGPRQTAPKAIYHTLDIFETVLERPLDQDNFLMFTNLLIALCGTKAHKYANKVVFWLQQNLLSKVAQRKRNNDFNLLQEYTHQFINAVEALESGNTRTNQFIDLTLIVRLFSKMVRQNYLLFIEINYEALKAVLSNEER